MGIYGSEVYFRSEANKNAHPKRFDFSKLPTVELTTILLRCLQGIYSKQVGVAGIPECTMLVRVA
jgi:hypothetical protein